MTRNLKLVINTREVGQDENNRNKQIFMNLGMCV